MPRRTERQVLLLALALFGATGLLAQRAPDEGPVGRTVGRLTAPVQHALTDSAARVRGLFSGNQERAALRERIQQLETANAELLVQSTKLEALMRENAQLRDELSFQRERVDLDLMGASVIGQVVARDPGQLSRTVKIDIGRADDGGIGRGMAVATRRGLVGQVVRTSDYFSDVRLITDPLSEVQGRIERSRATGMVSGSATGQLVMRFIPQSAADGPPSVEVGDVVYTSGLSEYFPPDIPIGQVVEVRQQDVATHQSAIIRPSVSFNALEIVLVVRDWLPASQGDGATSDDPPPASQRVAPGAAGTPGVESPAAPTTGEDGAPPDTP